MKITLEQAYAEACQALGEAVVRERLMAQQLARDSEEPNIPEPEPTGEE